MVLTSSHYNWFIAVITQKQTGGEETEKDVFINIINFFENSKRIKV